MPCRTLIGMTAQRQKRTFSTSPSGRGATLSAMRILRGAAAGIVALGRRASTVAFLIIGGALAVAACGTDGGGQVLDSGGKHVLVGPPANGGDDAAIYGRVTLIGDCLGIGSSVAVWPNGTTIVSDDPLTIEVPDLGQVKVGDEVDGGGGTHDPGDAPDGVTIPDTCKSATIVSWRPE